MAAATNTNQTEEHVSLKLVLNQKGNKVLFAEAGNDFVDVLCSFLTMPLGTIARLVEKKSSIGPVSVGCLNSLYKSVADLDQSCFSTHTIKQMLLQPINSAEDYCSTLKLNIDDTPPTKYFLFGKYNYHSRFDHELTTSTFTNNHRCCCGYYFSRPVSSRHFYQGFVNATATFVITDDFIVIPNCIEYSSFGLLQKLGIEDPISVKEMNLNVTKEKVLDLLKCSLLSKSTLTNFFLGKKPSIGVSRFFLSDVDISGNIQIILKLVIRKSDGKVLCAQGEQDFANLLLSFLTFPLGGIARIFGENCSLENINRLYTSISHLNESKNLISKEAKNRLVDPCIAPQFKLRKQILPILDPDVIEYYCFNNIKEILVQFCKAGEDMQYVQHCKRINLSNNEASHEGYVKGPAMYVATDDLAVTRLSPISALGLLNRFQTPLSE